MRTILTTLTVVLMSGTSVFAADVIQDIAPEPVPFVQPFTWTGGYAGVQAGYGFGDVDIDADDDSSLLDDLDDDFDFDSNDDGFLGGVHVGYNYQFGAGNGFVLGAYADIDFTTLDIQVDDIDDIDGIDDDEIGDVDFIARGMAKVGYAFDRTLVYGQAGVAYLSADLDVLDDDINEAGYAVGAGLDYAITDNVVIGGDYVFHQFDDVANGDDEFDVDGVDLDVHTIRAKLSYKF